LSLSSTVFSIALGREFIFLLIEGESPLNSTIIFDFFVWEGLPYLTLNAETDFDFFGITGDSIFLRTRFDTCYCLLLYYFYSTRSIGLFNMFTSKTFLLLMLYRYYSDNSSSLLSIYDKCSFSGRKINLSSSCSTDFSFFF